MFYTQWNSPVGVLLLESDGSCLTGVKIGAVPRADAELRQELAVFRQTSDWLDAYFAGTPIPASDLPLEAVGTPFQKMVWDYLLTVPWGKTYTYGEIAREIAARLGKQKMSAQAVGQAVGRNPIGIIIPCHRCVGAGGKLTGYAGGIEKKAWLLRHEEAEL